MADKTQNNNTATQKTSAQAAPNSNVKPKFSCKDCTFTCNSHINFRVHLRSVHSIELPTENQTPPPPKKPTAVVIQKPPVVYNAPPQTAGIIQKPPVVQNSSVPTAIVLQKTPIVQKSPVPTAIVLQKSTTVQKSLAPQNTAGIIQNNNKGNQNASFKAVPNQNFNSTFSWKEATLGLKCLGPQNPAVKIQNNDKGNQNASLNNVPNPNARAVYSWKPPTTVEESPVPQTTAENIQNNNNNKDNQNAAPKAPLKPLIKAKFLCKECNFTCNAIQNYKTHLQNVHGKKDDENAQNSSTLKPAVQEKPKVKDALTSKPDKPKKKVPIFHPAILFNPSGKDISKLKDYLSRTDREPLIGLEYVLEYRFKTQENQIVTKYFCELCECDMDLDPMVEHLAGFRHRKQYLEKEYPYVLKAQASSKEERSQFIRRMALEIEREEGTKMYMIDPSVWMETMMTLRTADKKMRKKTRWDDDRNDQNRMAKALKFLESFEVESELEATTVARLCEKLSDNLRLHQNKAKQDSLFPARVARAQDVAMSLMQNAAKQRTHVQNLTQMTLKPKISIVLNKEQPTLPENTSKAFVSTFVPLSGQQGMDRPQSEKESESAKGLSQEDTQFFKRLMALLEALPQNASVSDSSEMNSKLQILKSVLVNQKTEEREQANQQLMKQVAAIVQDTISAQNATLNQQLMMLMTSQNSTSMVMQTASLQNNLLQLNNNSVMSSVGLVPGLQSSGNMQMNMNALMPLKQNIGSQVYGQMGETAARPVALANYQVPRVEMQNYPSTSQKHDNLGYGTSMERNYLPKADPLISKPDGIATGRQNEQIPISKTNVGYEPKVYNKEWDSSYYKTSPQLSETRYADRTGKQAPYTRVTLSPASPQNHYGSYNDARGEVGMGDVRQRPGLRAYGSSDWDGPDNDMHYTKRARLDTENRADLSESYRNQPIEPLLNTAGRPEELLKRIQGKDLFTASAVLRDYSDRR